MTRSSARKSYSKTTKVPGLKSYRGEFALLLVALVWGITFPLVKTGLNYTSPFTFLSLRFGLGFLLFAVVMRPSMPSPGAWKAGALLVFFLGTSFFSQTMGLNYTSSTRAAFITALSVVLVPMLYPAITRKSPGMWPVLGSLLALGGIYLLTDPGGAGINRGDVITLFCALGFALYMIYLEVATKKHPFKELMTVQVFLMGLVFVPGALTESQTQWSAMALWGIVLSTAVIIIFTMSMQTRFQKETTATRAAVIFAMEPVFAAGFSFLLLNETLTPLQGVGALTILIAILIAEKR